MGITPKFLKPLPLLPLPQLPVIATATPLLFLIFEKRYPLLRYSATATFSCKALPKLYLKFSVLLSPLSKPEMKLHLWFRCRSYIPLGIYSVSIGLGPIFRWNVLLYWIIPTQNGTRSPSFAFVLCFWQRKCFYIFIGIPDVMCIASNSGRLV